MSCPIKLTKAQNDAMWDFFMKTSIPRMYKEEMENENKRKAMVINDCGGQVNGIEKGVKPVQAKIQKHREYLTKKVEQNLQNKNGVSLHRMDRLAKLRSMIFDLAEQAINELWDNVAEINEMNAVKTVEVKDEVKGADTVKSVQQRQMYISIKNKQHNALTDAHKYQHRLKWLMRYHALLTQLEIAEIKQCVKRATQN